MHLGWYFAWHGRAGFPEWKQNPTWEKTQVR